MDENLIRLLIETGGVGGTIIMVVWLFRPIFLAWLGNIAKAREHEAQRIRDERESERELASALNGIKSELKLSRGINNQLIERIGTLPTRDDIVQAGQTMHEWATKHDTALAAAHTDLKTVPAEVWRIGDPKFETLRQALEDHINNLEKRLIERIDPQAENARQLIRKEMQTLLDRVQELDTALRALQPQEQ
jgi:membrane-associated HD superfamily phosphohydrolase